MNMTTNKLRVIQDFDKLPRVLQDQIRDMYPDGFTQNLITFSNKDGKLTSALPFETPDKIYLIRMLHEESEVVYEEDDYEDYGLLKEATKDKFAGKFAETDFFVENETADDNEDEDDEDIEDDSFDDDDDDDDDDEDIEETE